jgi:DNA-binding transcriptional regulator YhcF (GntR family)
MPVNLSIDASSQTPPFEQLRRNVVEALERGELAPGTRLPTVRSLAEDLGLAVNTVAKAYRALEGDHIIETRGRNGTFIAASGDPARQEAQRAALDYADRIARLGVPADEALSIVAGALGADR